MKLFQMLSRKSQPSTDNTPTISSLKSEELWQFIQRPEEDSENSSSRATDLANIWAEAQSAASRATRGTGQGKLQWAINSH